MRDLEERIERAARAAFTDTYGGTLAWQTAPEGVVAEHRLAAKAMLATAFPELFGDPPTAWLAPMEATREIAAAYARWYRDNYREGMELVDTPASDAWVAMRNAFLKGGDA